MATYEELLNDTAETGDEAAVPATADVQEPESQDSPEDLPESPESPESEAVPEKKQVPQVPLKALEAERHRRQSVEQQVAAQQRQIEMLIQTLQTPRPEAPASTPAPAVPDFLTENDKWQQALFQNIGRMLDEREQQAWVQKVQAAEEEMRESTADYDDLVTTHFKPAAQRDPTLQQKLRAAANPAKFAYRTAKRLQAETELGGELDFDKIRAKVEAEVRAKVLAELQGKQAELEAKVKLPVSLGSTGTSAPVATEKIPEGGSWRARDLYGN